ncbi:hypothetical protein, partial [Pseudomonas helleri]
MSIIIQRELDSVRLKKIKAKDFGSVLFMIFTNSPPPMMIEIKYRAVAGAECNTVIELKPEHHAASPRH